ncbi:hypothetical protein ACHAXR_006619 [Thalassiosira sp. AJA248-18]
MFVRLILSLAVAVGATISSANAQTPLGSIDIGGPTLAGSSSGGGSDWSVKASGSDIWSASDQFHYMYFNRTADVTVTCLMKSFTGSTNGWRKGGIMFRKELTHNSAHSMIQQFSHGVAQQSRGAEGHHTAHTSIDHYSSAMTWLRLVKEGNTITSFVKRDGDYEFLKFHSVEVDLGPSFYIGLAVTSHDNNQLATMEVSDFSISDEVFSLSNTISTTEIGATGSGIFVQEVKPDLWKIYAAGAGIGGTADNFVFADTEHTGDVTATLHLEKLVRRNDDTKGGLMMRASHDEGAPHVSLLVKSSTGITMFYRADPDGDTLSKNVGVWEEDMELKLAKVGNTVTCSYKHADAAEWFVLGSATAALDSNPDGSGSYFVGQAVASADYGDRITMTAGSVVVTA